MLTPWPGMFKGFRSNIDSSYGYSGRTLGGSSAINFMVYTKPPAEEVDG